jgi:hypothetical protein
MAGATGRFQNGVKPRTGAGSSLAINRKRLTSD